MKPKKPVRFKEKKLTPENRYRHKVLSLLNAAKAVIAWRNFDGDGISDPTRANLIKTIADVEAEDD